MAQFVQIGDRGVNLDLVASWSYVLPAPGVEAQTTIIFASGRVERFVGLAADALIWRLSEHAPDAERAYMDHWTAQAAAQTQRRHADEWRAAQYEREQAAADAHDAAMAREDLQRMRTRQVVPLAGDAQADREQSEDARIAAEAELDADAHDAAADDTIAVYREVQRQHAAYIANDGGADIMRTYLSETM